MGGKPPYQSSVLFHFLFTLFPTVCEVLSKMKEFDIQVTCQENVKPSSPAPDSLRRYELSFLDQIQPPMFMPMLLFYPKEDTITNAEQLERIKKSLSEALTVFYPLAGRIKGNNYVDCNDEGVYFVEAQASCHLSDVLESRDPNNNNKFIPLELDDDIANELPAMAQVTFFQCGGLAVFLGMSHKVGDALSYFMFLNCWAAIARGDTDIVRPQFDAAALFPPKDISGFQPRTGIVKENIVARRFVFDASAISALRDRYTDTDSINGKRPTRVEALSAFIWSRFIALSQGKTDEGKLYTLLHAVNLRTRTDPPLSGRYFGNISRPAITVPSTDTSEEGCRVIVKQMRESIKKTNDEYVKKLQRTDGHMDFMRERAAKFIKGELVSLNFTSLCRFPIYAADFGWGKPEWVGSARLTFKNLVSFFDTKTGDGIEAWFNMKEEDMAKLETDKEFLSYVSPTPNA